MTRRQFLRKSAAGAAVLGPA
ncbi:MAG: twin-arginine translocation signal domain-containing protein [Armatimonadetes bacterium]|nr:twin-arginine translocation signal domain-containing protein [Armatimonadota bacterium]